MHRKQLTHIFSLLLLFAACFLGGTLLARATASEAGESDNAGNETTGVSSETAGTANEADASASKSWGLSYQEEGKRPQGTDALEDLAAHGAYYARDTEEKVLYLTFDCGYENGNTAKILDTLKKKNVPAAFFLTGDFLRSARTLQNESQTKATPPGTTPNTTRTCPPSPIPPGLKKNWTASPPLTRRSPASRWTRIFARHRANTASRAWIWPARPGTPPSSGAWHTSTGSRTHSQAGKKPSTNSSAASTPAPSYFSTPPQPVIHNTWENS